MGVGSLWPLNVVLTINWGKLWLFLRIIKKIQWLGKLQLLSLPIKSGISNYPKNWLSSILNSIGLKINLVTTGPKLVVKISWIVSTVHKVISYTNQYKSTPVAIKRISTMHTRYVYMAFPDENPFNELKLFIWTETGLGSLKKLRPMATWNLQQRTWPRGNVEGLWHKVKKGSRLRWWAN